MEPETTMKPPSASTSGNFGLLRYEIDRVKSLLETHGESPAMRERLNRLEDLLEVCLSPLESGQPV